MGTKKFTHKDRARTIKIVKGIFASEPGIKYGALADRLNQDGVAHPNGPWTRSSATNFTCKYLGGTRKLNRAGRSDPRTDSRKEPNSDRVTLAELVLSTSMSSSDKERVLRGLFN